MRREALAMALDDMTPEDIADALDVQKRNILREIVSDGRCHESIYRYILRLNTEASGDLEQVSLKSGFSEWYVGEVLRLTYLPGTPEFSDQSNAVRLFEAGRALPDIAQELGTDLVSVIRFLVQEKRYQHYLNSRVLDMHAAGASVEQIVEATGFDDMTIQLILNGDEYELKDMSPIRVKLKEKAILLRKTKNMSNAEISRELDGDIPKSTLQRWLAVHPRSISKKDFHIVDKEKDMREVFELTGEHLAMLSRLQFVSALRGGPRVNTERPYGNEDHLVSIIRDILGEELFVAFGGDEYLSQEQGERATRLHGEMRLALEVVLQARSFAPGSYIKNEGRWIIEDDLDQDNFNDDPEGLEGFDQSRRSGWHQPTTLDSMLNEG